MQKEQLSKPQKLGYKKSKINKKINNIFLGFVDNKAKTLSLLDVGQFCQQKIGLNIDQHCLFVF